MSATTPTMVGPRDQAFADTRPPRSLWSDAARRFRRNKLAVLGVLYLLFLIVVAVCAPLIAPHNPVRSDIARAGQFRKAAWSDDANPRRAGLWEYPLGTDSVGRDVFSRLVYATRVSLIVGFIPMFFTLLIGVTIGLLAGFAGGRVDNLLMRLTDVVYAFPDLLFFIIMQISFRETAFGQAFNGLVLLFVTLSIVNWTGVARLVRGQVLSLKEKEFVEAARATGTRNWQIVLRHILPNSLGPIIVAGAFIIPNAIITEAILSFLGIGVRPSIDPANPFPSSWGNMIFDGKAGSAWQSQPWMLIAPSIAVALLTLAFTFIGDGLRDALDPRDNQ